jgi:DNA-binding beta-propeller fold protein YncE
VHGAGDTGSVEGITVGPDGNIYVPTFGFNAKGGISGNSVLFMISPNGKIVRQVTIKGSSSHMLGLAFTPVSNMLLVIDFGAGKVLNVDPMTDSSNLFMAAPGAPGLNARSISQVTSMCRIHSKASSGRLVPMAVPRQHGVQKLTAAIDFCSSISTRDFSWGVAGKAGAFFSTPIEQRT